MYRCKYTQHTLVRNPCSPSFPRRSVIPAQAGIHSLSVRHSREGGNPPTWNELDARLRGQDESGDKCLCVAKARSLRIHCEPSNQDLANWPCPDWTAVRKINWSWT